MLQQSPETVTGETVLANARLVLQDEVVLGSLVISGDEIRAVDSGSGVPAGAIDCGGDLVMPGLIEVHTDNLERHIEPRPGVAWPHMAAIVAHDAELAGAGITTVFDAMRLGSVVEGKSRYLPYARNLANELFALRDQGALRISHFLHLRAEICSETLPEELDDFGPEDRVGLVSLMDHTPGQRQFRDVEKLKAYVMGKGLSEAEFHDHIREQVELGDRVRDRHEAAAVAFVQRVGAHLASHDDTTEEHVAASARHGATLAEFPTTLEAAHASQKAGLAVIMGAPNLIRGGSHSGNVSAAELAEDGLIDIVSSDYVPAALLQSAMRLGEIWEDLPRAIATVTATPAKRLELDDRGALKPGLRADLVRVSTDGGVVRTTGTWSRGRRVG
ncbi:alpha-D-ribose 1-methylphosphonate 5-triphosphate diphosphatase [Aestuariibius sp. 2305UL40-4]|uniref:alpha-D-ribose 1-methylphosphonate 5-triphosphate diphosphatase n=1 Tax=Aestuariibius violaceus TaxID=3234132 RepID=UPI00345E0F8A